MAAASAPGVRRNTLSKAFGTTGSESESRGVGYQIGTKKRAASGDRLGAN